MLCNVIKYILVSGSEGMLYPRFTVIYHEASTICFEVANYVEVKWTNLEKWASATSTQYSLNDIASVHTKPLDKIVYENRTCSDMHCNSSKIKDTYQIPYVFKMSNVEK